MLEHLHGISRMGEDLRGANKVVDLLGEINQVDLLGAIQRKKIKMTAGVNHLGGTKDLVVQVEEGEEELAGMHATSVGKRGIWLGNALRAGRRRERWRRECLLQVRGDRTYGQGL